MFLKNLTIKNEETIIRTIDFHAGINLIIDETKTENKQESGNSVGKTTVLRLIDFCLDGDGKNIYTDAEFKNSNTKVEAFLTNNNITVSLELVSDLNKAAPHSVLIERNFLKRKDKIQKINGESQSNDEFSKTLKELIFKTTSDKPTFKQLKSKNIRDEKNKLEKTLRILNPYTTAVEYETLHLFWFGIDINLSKDKLVRAKTLEEKLQQRLRKDSNLSQITQSLLIVDKEIAKLNERRKLFCESENYEEQFEIISSLKSKINYSSSKLSHMEMRKELITESKEDLEQDIANIDVARIRELYNRAKTLIPNIQKTFEQTLKFHNDMLSQKIKFIGEDLPQLEEDIIREQQHLNSLIKEERSIALKMGETHSITDLEDIISDLNMYHEKKGSLEEQKSVWQKSNKKLADIEEQVDLINSKIDAKDHVIQKRIAQFNEYFSDISSRLDGAHSVLSADKTDDIYKFEIGNIEGNPGTGSKKSQMASFDLSYIKFADEMGIPCLHFVLQDQIENVHSNQITNLLTDIVEEVNCQYVLPVLRDKLPKEINIQKYETLSLSQDDKLFRIR